MIFKDPTYNSHNESTIMLSLRQGDCVQLISDEGPFQVIGVDTRHEKCWIRKWPLLPNGSPVFEISIGQIAGQWEGSKENHTSSIK